MNTIGELVVLLRRREERIEELHTQLDAWMEVYRAVLKGPAPRHHDEITAQHRRQWPALWAAIDNAPEVQP